MPLCCGCDADRPRSDFSKAQLKKISSQRRCNHCIGQQESPHSEPVAPTATNRSLVMVLIDEVIPILFQRGIPMDPSTLALLLESKGTNNEKDRSARMAASVQVTPDVAVLRRRLIQVLHQDSVLWLAIPLLEGLLYAGDLINRRVFIPGSGEPFPLLHCLCQYKLLKKQFQYKGANDLVALTLRAGAMVNDKLGNGCTALFFAVKYGSAETVQLLVQAGADTAATDIYGQTCWKNAVEYAIPSVIEALIRLGVSVHENIETGREEGGREQKTLPDFMLNQFISTSSGSPSGDPFSWYLFGLPQFEDYATSIIRVLQAGASFSSFDMGLAVCVHASAKQVTRRMDAKKRNLLVQISRVLFGEKLPDAILKEVQKFDDNFVRTVDRNTHGLCKICNNTMGDRDSPITLYCGHIFCLECVKSLRLSKSSNPTCTVCNRKLGRDLLSSEARERRPPSHLLGIDHRNEEESSEPRGPWVLTDKQLEIECEARGVLDNRDLTRQERLEEMQAEPKLSLSYLLELSSTRSFVVDGRQYLAPKEGPAVIPITVKGIPILAWLSPTSPLTVLSKDFVENFRLQKKELGSKEFIQYDGSELDRFWAIKEFSFEVGDIEIRLNNAICYQFAEESDRPRGVQLGMDFFDTAAWAQVSVQLDGSFMKNDDNDDPVKEDENETQNDVVYAIADGCGPLVVTGDPQPEEIRFYSRTGQMFRSPLIQVLNLSESDFIPIVSLPNTVQFTECEWCSRCFPTGMKACAECEALGRQTYYCDEACRQQAMAVHNHG
ncbi:hypothetical protein ACA910_016045 [Epithemia clementina (nom. ined.)]